MATIHPDAVLALKPHLHSLKVLATSNPKLARAFLKTAPASFIRAICETAYNILKGNVNLSSAEHAKFKKKRKILRQIGDKNLYSTVQLRKTVKQRGAGISKDLAQLIIQKAFPNEL